MSDFLELLKQNIALRQQLERARSENQELLTTLIDAINQACHVRYESEPPKYIVDHQFLSAYENAIDLLERLGCAKPLPNEGWELVWPEPLKGVEDA